VTPIETGQANACINVTLSRVRVTLVVVEKQ
jgi:hypothetical protein